MDDVRDALDRAHPPRVDEHRTPRKKYLEQLREYESRAELLTSRDVQALNALLETLQNIAKRRDMLVV